MARLMVAAICCSLPLAACHPPDQAIYDSSKACLGVFDVALRQVRPDQFRKAGLFSDDVDHQALATYEGMPQTAAKLGLDNQRVRQDLAAAKAQAWRTYGQPAGRPDAPPSPALIAAVEQCMPKPEGPNE